GWDFSHIQEIFEVKLIGEKLFQVFEKQPELFKEKIIIKFKACTKRKGPVFHRYYVWSLHSNKKILEKLTFSSLPFLRKKKNFFEIQYIH
ncbi:MAG: hypothetical protein ACP5PR_02675, partial [Minisyncoccia bacterium]